MGYMGLKLLGGDAKFDFTENLHDYPNTMYFLGTECSDLGYDFLIKTTEIFENSELIKVEGPYGHYLSVENPALVYEIINPLFN